MITIQNGYTFQFNDDASELICGYQTCKHVDLMTSVETPWLLNGSGEWYPCGWTPSLPCVFMPTAVSPPQTAAYDWSLASHSYQRIGVDGDAVGSASLAVIDGVRLSTNGRVLFLNGEVITPEPFLGVVWDDTEHYGYKRGWDGGGPFVVRRLDDHTIAREIDAAGMWERCYTLSDGPWVTGQYSGASYVYSPAQTLPLPAHELAGPVLERDGVIYVVSAVMGAQQNPRGVMVRPWAEIVNGTLYGWYCDGVRHQCLQARVNPRRELVVGGCEFPGTGVITIEAIPVDRPMGLVPPEVTVPPVDPPKPPVDPIPPVLLASHTAGIAPLKVQATVYDWPAGVAIHWQKSLEAGPWLDVIVSADTTYFYTFTVPGIWRVQASTANGLLKSNTRTIQVMAKPEPEPPPPQKPKPWWLILLDRVFGRA